MQVGLGFAPEPFHGLQAQRVRQGLGHRGVAAQLPGIGQERVGAVEEPQLPVFVRLDLVHEHRAGVFPPRASGREVPAEHPVAERLGHHGRVVAVAARGLHRGEVRFRGARRDAVHRGADKADVRVDPGGQAGVPGLRQAHYGVVGHRSVVGQVVAADDGERAGAGSPAGGEGKDEPAQRRRRRSAAGGQQRKVRDDVGGRPVQAAVGAQAVGGLGDGQGDHRRGRCGDKGGEPADVGAVHCLDDAADDLEGIAAVGPLDQRVQAVLLGQCQRSVRAAAGEGAMPHSAASPAWWVYQAWCERWKAPSPRWTIRTGALAEGRMARLSCGRRVGSAVAAGAAWSVWWMVTA